MGKSAEIMRQLADLWAELAAREEGFICTEAAQRSGEIVGGTIYGYFTEDNPNAELGQSEGGHDFVLSLTDDAAEIAHSYGERARWQDIQERERLPISFGWECDA